MKKSGKAAYISESDLQLTLKSLKGKNSVRNQAVLLASHFMGLRAKEMASLKMGDVYDTKRNCTKETIRLLGAYTKGNKYREVFLMDEHVKKTIMLYIKTERPCNDPNAPLFLSQKGGSFSANTMQKMIANLYKKAGLKASSHSGRRSFATRLIRKNVDIYSIQQLMGHSSIMTTQVYFASDPNMLRDAVSKLSE